MLTHPIDVLKQFPVRKTKVQKQAFRTAVQAYGEKMGYPVTVEKGSFGACNLLLGDPEKAKYLVTAHYDTCASMLLPNFITPCNVAIYLLYQFGLVFLMVIGAGTAGVAAGFLFGSEAVKWTSLAVYWLLLLLLILGPANRNNANDNTSGVVTLLEIARTLPENQRHKVCFVLFDLEEAGLIGSASYRRKHKKASNNQIVLNLDCVGDGDHLRMFPTKQLRKNRRKLASLYRACGYFGKKSLLVHEKGAAVYPSDQKHFPYGVGICALGQRKKILYMSRIHTKRDTVLEETNVNILRAALTTFLCRDEVNLERKITMKLYDELVARGLIAQVTDEEKVREMIDNGKATFYIGFDPTADSLHVGHFMALCLMKRLQMAGNRPIALIGGGTAMIGDPSGRTDMRSMMTKETIQHNCDCFKKQMARFIEFGEGKAMMVNNADWLLDLNYVDVLREVGACFSVNNMLRAECYKQRMEKGLSFLEFNYMIMQSYDFYYLYQKYGCNMQFGGNDQWSNMLGGRELIRRKLEKYDSEAMTITLLLNSEGKKMGKTASGAVWLDPNKTSPYEFYQYWRNVEDADVLKCIRMLTFLPMEEIDAMSDWKDAQLNTAKEILAYELTKLVHGEEEAAKAQASAKALFLGGGDDANMPTTEVSADNLVDGRIGFLNLMVLCGLAPSNKQARQLVQQGGVFVNDEKMTDAAFAVTEDMLKAGLKIRKGKKVFHKAVLA